MEPPFPGMDPYLEDPSMWPDVHHRLITSICDQIQLQLTSAYRAVITPYSSFESIEIAPTRRFVPDVAVLERSPFDLETRTVVALEEAPLVMTAAMTVEVEYARIDIRTVRDQLLITAIELLSPANKRQGLLGATAYETKRQDIFASSAHLLEIDLLRMGIRPQVTRPLPKVPYFIFLSRAYQRPWIEIWPLSLRAPIKPVPVPLRSPDPPVALDLSLAIHESYRRARYDLEIDYREPPPAPELDPDDLAWLDQHLRDCGLRP